MTWVDGRMCGFDVETTATNPEEARIVVAAVVSVGGGVATEVLSLMADPGVPIPEEATAVHGITTELAAKEGHPPPDVLTAVLALLRACAYQSQPIVAFNARYDLTVLDREARRHGIPPLQDVLVVDPLVVDKHLDRYRRGSRKLEAMCAHYGATHDGAHDAAADALAACRLAWCLAKRGQVLRQTRTQEEGAELMVLQDEWERVRHDLPALHGAQQVWAREQAESLAAYFRDKGDPAAEYVRTEWPVLPMRAAVAP